ncbi:MAG TPA: pyridoxal phosphate-dependent aminotransferase [Acidimicrobiia bacterium]|nr:pyridoxal phosphate-dependent aminotransferase [Acidimicrobiia bacterium]
MRTNPVLDQLGAYPIAEIQDTARRMRDAGERLIDFSLGDPVEPTPEFIRQAAADAIPEVSQYPTVAGLASLRRAIAGWVERRFGVEVDPDTQIVPTSGAKEAIFTTPFAFIDRKAGDAGVFCTPGYPIHERGLRFAGAEAIGVTLTGDFVLRAADIPADAWDRLRMIWTCSPQNPTGAVTPREDLSELLEESREHDTLLCSDEAYADLWEEAPPASVLEVAGPGAKGALAFFSCSKRSGMTGYRTAAIVGDAEAIKAIKSLRSSVGVSSPEFIQAAATAAWSDDEHAERRRRIFNTKREILRRRLEEDGIAVVGSTAGLYLWLAVDDDIEATSRLLAGGVVVSPGSAFGPGGEGHLRLALVPSVDECVEAAEVVAACLRPAN